MSVNKAILVGHVGKDPEIRHMESGIAVATITLATTERGYTLPNGTQVPDRTEWHSIVAWRGLAEIAEKYIVKGSQIYVEGRITTRKWEKDGVARYSTEIQADVIDLLGKRPDAGEQQAAKPQVQPQQNAPKPAPTSNGPSGNDDMPF